MSASEMIDKWERDGMTREEALARWRILARVPLREFARAVYRDEPRENNMDEIRLQGRVK